MRRGSLRNLRGRLEAIERAGRFTKRGVWISPEEIEAVKAKMRRALGLPPMSSHDSKRSQGFFYAPGESALTAREKLIARLKSR